MLERIALAYGIRDRLAFDDRLAAHFARLTSDAESFDVASLLPATLGELVEKVGGNSRNVADDSSDSLLSGHRVAIVTNYPAHYRLPLFEGMSTRLSNAGARFHVMYLGAEAKSRPWLAGSRMRFDHETIRSLRVPVAQRGPMVPMGFATRLRRLRATIVIAAGFSPFVAGRAAVIARETGASFGFWSGETGAMSTARQVWRELFRKRLVARSDFAIAYGARAAAYIRGLSPELPLVVGRNTSPTVAARDPSRRLDDRPVRLLLIGDLASTRKGADVALDAMRYVANGDVRLHIVGSGRLQTELEQRAAADARVRFLGSLRPEDVAKQLQATDALLFPTRSDIFGLVLVEAMGAGVASIVSRAAGAVDDLAVDGQNAIVVEGHDPIMWANAIQRVVDDPTLAGKLGKSARATIENRWTMEHAVDAMIAGLRLGALANDERVTA
jgi:glycosyltransferase involved in cell wall biosynthesis